VGDTGKNIPPAPFGSALSFQLSNRNKRGVALNLKLPSAQQVLERLASGPTCSSSTHPHPARKKLKLEYDDVAQWKSAPDLCGSHRLSARKVRRALPGFDLTAYWARSGLLYMTRDAGAPPTGPVSGSGDNATAVAIYAGIATALYRRERTGKGPTSRLRSLRQVFGQPVSSSGRAMRCDSNVCMIERIPQTQLEPV